MADTKTRLFSLAGLMRLWGLGVTEDATAHSRLNLQREVCLSIPGWVAVAWLSLGQALALPPAGLSLLGFLVPAAVVWLSVTTRPASWLRVVFWWGVVQWMLTFHFIRLPHWAGWIGWPLLAAYFALYNVALIGMTRRLVQVSKWSVLIAVPVVWVGLEVLRSTLLSGLPIGLLGHSLYRYPLLIQTADIAGELTVSFLMAMVGAGFGCLLLPLLQRGPVRSQVTGSHWLRRPALLGFLAIALGLGLMVGYGRWQMEQYAVSKDESSIATIALVQGAHDIRFDLSQEEALAAESDSFQSHQRLTLQARANPEVAAVIWAESMFPAIDILPFDTDKYREFLQQQADADGNVPRWRMSLNRVQMFREELPWAVKEVTGTGPSPPYPYEQGMPLIVGMRTFDPDNDRDYNAAIYLAPDGSVIRRYYKVHLVPFGEFLPLGEWFPWMYQMAPMPRGLTPGTGVEVFQVGEARLVPTICYESVMGVLIRRYLGDLSRVPTQRDENSERAPWDALLNMSNDGWFWGSNALDLHLASNVFRAIENRTQHLVVCNTGISANINAQGAVLEEGAKRQVGLLLAKVHPRPKQWQPMWWTVGQWPWWGCLAIVVGTVLWSFRKNG